MRIVNIFYVLLGFAALGLGIVGIILPLLPSTPFLLLAGFCFAKGSNRFHTRLLNTWFYKKYMLDFSKTRAITIKAKLRICMAASILVAIPFMFTPFWIMRIIIFCVLAFKWYFFIFRIKTFIIRGSSCNSG